MILQLIIPTLPPSAKRIQHPLCAQAAVRARVVTALSSALPVPPRLISYLKDCLLDPSSSVHSHAASTNHIPSAIATSSPVLCCVFQGILSVMLIFAFFQKLVAAGIVENEWKRLCSRPKAVSRSHPVHYHALDHAHPHGIFHGMGLWML